MRIRLIGFLLAAGYSRRFGGDKRRHRLPDGRSLLQASADTLGAQCDSLHIAIRASDWNAETGTHTLSDCLTLAPHWYVHPVHQNNAGMGDTLAELAQFGLQRSDAPDADPTAILVGLGDMPAVQPDTLQRLVTRFSEQLAAGQHNPIVAPRYRGQRGHPVLFAYRWLPLLAHCTGDTGARQVFETRQAAITWLDTEDAGVLHDIDVPSDPAPVSPGMK